MLPLGMLVGPNRGIQALTITPTVDELSVLHNGDTAIATGSSLDHYKLSDGKEFDLKTRWSVTLVDKNGKMADRQPACFDQLV